MDTEDCEFTPRPYQTELLNVSIDQNTILYLPTGSGKTYIAVMLIKRLGSEIINKSYAEGAKRTVFLVNTVSLVQQQADFLRHTQYQIGKYSGELQCDFWDKQKWHEELTKYNVLVMTSQILLNIIQHGYFDLGRCNLLIFDECHHGVVDHPMRQIMQHFESVQTPPRVLGLTATLLNRNVKPSQVLAEVEALERTYQSKIATVEGLNTVLGFSTDPIEGLEYYGEDSPDSCKQTVIQKLTDLKQILCDIRFPVKSCPARHQRKDVLLITDGPNAGSRVVNIITDIIWHIEECGLYGGGKAVLSHMVQFERLKKHAQEQATHQIMMMIVTSLTSIYKYIQDYMDDQMEIKKIYQFSSEKVKQLLETLKRYNPRFRRSDDKALCGIIFVQRRFTAKVLYHIIQAAIKSHEDFAFLSVDFMVGFNNNPYNDTREGCFENKKNMQAVQRFKRKETNLLIASNVIEEGLDVPQCTLVLMFDLPMNYRSYIQTKGRARHKDSNYYMFVKTTNKTFLERLRTYREVEKMLQRMLVGKNSERTAPTETEIVQDLYQHAVAPYVVPKTKATCTLSAAISLVNRYCSSLPQDMFTVLAPTWYKTQLVDRAGRTYVKVFIELPIVSVIRTEIAGPWMDNTKDAKRAAALETVRLLHEMNELDDNLLPIPKSKIIENVDYLFPHWPSSDEDTQSENTDASGKLIQSKPGSNKRKRLYSKLCPDTLYKCSPSETCENMYLHIIEFIPAYKPPSEIESTRPMFYNMLKSKQTYAILSKKKFPPLCDFPIYLSCGEITIHLRVNGRIDKIDGVDLMDLQTFHTFLFADVLKMLKPFLIFDLADEEYSIIIVPVKHNHHSYIIDMESARKYRNIEVVEEPNIQDKRAISVTENSYVGAVVYPWYRSRDIGYVVCEVAHGMTARSPFPSDGYEDFVDYFEQKWQLRIENPTEPLILVKAMSNKLNCLKPRSNTQSTLKRKLADRVEDFEEHFIPELCVRMSFPALFWLKAKCLPTILHRINYLLLADQLRRRIHDETSIGRAEPPNEVWAPLMVDKHLCDPKFDVDNVGNDVVDEGIVSGRVSPLGEELDMKKLEFQVELADRVSCPWKEDQEPVDIERNMESVTLLEIEYYERFVSELLSTPSECQPHVDIAKSPPHLAAITYDPINQDASIKILDRSISHSGPQLWQVYQAIVSAHANDVLNLERFETLGDSFLKFGASLYLMLKFPDWNEGKLTQVKGQVVGNKNLFYAGRIKGFGSIMKVNEFAPNSDWYPPKFCVPRFLQSQFRQAEISANVLYDFEIPNSEQVSGRLSRETHDQIIERLLESVDERSKVHSSMEDFLSQQTVSDKTIADCVEAIIGCYLNSNGVTGAFKILEWFGILPTADDPSNLLNREPPSPILDIAKPNQADIDFHLPGWKMLENSLGYHFKNRGYLLQAMTHSSYSPNRLTNCYQTLEFIGDAILDFLITCYIYEKCGTEMTPGDVTDLRSALVNNVVFASLVVKNGFHKYLLALSPKLNDIILIFAKHQEDRKHVINDEVLILLEEGDYNLAEFVDVPKVLGDLFEALAGAIFLDSGMDLKVVWTVFYKLMKEQIDAFSQDIPKNPVRMLYEAPCANPKFMQVPEKAIDGASMVRLMFMVAGKKKIVYGFGENKKQAKRAASKIALRAIASNRRIDEIIS